MVLKLILKCFSTFDKLQSVWSVLTCCLTDGHMLRWLLLVSQLGLDNELCLNNKPQTRGVAVMVRSLTRVTVNFLE